MQAKDDMEANIEALKLESKALRDMQLSSGSWAEFSEKQHMMLLWVLDSVECRWFVHDDCLYAPIRLKLIKVSCPPSPAICAQPRAAMHRLTPPSCWI